MHFSQLKEFANYFFLDGRIGKQPSVANNHTPNIDGIDPTVGRHMLSVHQQYTPY